MGGAMLERLGGRLVKKRFVGYDMGMDSLKKSFDYYKKHQDELATKYAGKFIVIVNNEVVGAYNTEIDAVQESLKQYHLGDFLVQYVESGEQNITQTFHSRVVVNGR